MFIKVGDKEAPNYYVIDCNTNKVIRGVQWADSETGQYKVIVFDKDGKIVLERDPITGLQYAKMEIKQGKIKLVRKK